MAKKLFVPEDVKAQLLDELYVTACRDGDTTWRHTHDTKTEAASQDDDGTYVATYKLVKIEKLKVQKSVSVVEAE